MTTSDLSVTPADSRRSAGVPAAARATQRLLQLLRAGRLTVQWPDGRMDQYGSDEQAAPNARIAVLDWRVCTAALREGDIGFAESYIAGHWHSADLTALLELLIRNRGHIESLFYGRWWGALWHRLRHGLRFNSRRGSRKNVQAHYDLGNGFYLSWLDPGMNYSSAWFAGDHSQDLASAQKAKLRRALAAAAVREGEGARVLEIGCGWGAAAEMGVAQFGARWTGITLSHEQLHWARRRLADAGLAAELRLQDYREVDDGPYDAIVSIEMFEAVGHAYWAEYFKAIRRLLAPHGRACIQTITIRDDLFERYRRSSDFIQRHIFPGGFLPSAQAFRRCAAQAGLVVEDEFEFGLDYAETLRRWRTRFLAGEAAVCAQGFDTRFVRTWEFYLAYCEAAFRAGNTSVRQFSLRRA